MISKKWIWFLVTSSLVLTALGPSGCGHHKSAQNSSQSGTTANTADSSNITAAGTGIPTILGVAKSIGRHDSAIVVIGNREYPFPGDNSEGSSVPDIIGKLTNNVAPYDEILVSQESPAGSACKGWGNVYFLGLKKSGTAVFFDSIPMCGRAPVLDADGNRIIFPVVDATDTAGLPPMARLQSGYWPEMVFLYQNGRITDLNIPVEITYDNVCDTSADTICIENSGKDTLDMTFEHIKPRSDSADSHQIAIMPHEKKKIGSSTMKYVPGDTIRIISGNRIPFMTLIWCRESL